MEIYVNGKEEDAKNGWLIQVAEQVPVPGSNLTGHKDIKKGFKR